MPFKIAWSILCVRVRSFWKNVTLKKRECNIVKSQNISISQTKDATSSPWNVFYSSMHFTFIFNSIFENGKKSLPGLNLMFY